MHQRRYPRRSAPNNPQITYGRSPQGSVVYYSIDSSITSLPAVSTDSSPAAQIIAAFAGWSAANAQPGGDGTTFVQATATNPATVIVNADLTYTTGGLVAQTQPQTDGVINASNLATITFHPNAVVPGTSNTAFFEALQTGYGTAYLEAALHEIGHLQGIGDYDPPTSAPAPGPDTSVVTPFIGINDIGNTYQKTAPTLCDVQQATSSSAAIAPKTSPPSPGGGTGGGGAGTSPGGGGVVKTVGCTEDNFDPDTNTVYGGTCLDGVASTE